MSDARGHRRRTEAWPSALSLVAAAMLATLAIHGCGTLAPDDCTEKATCADAAGSGASDGPRPGADARGAEAASTEDSSQSGFDANIVPDGPAPDGDCNGGVENCSNGVDDNCNGLVDCADPLCQSAGYACAPGPPAGWTGPVAFVDVAGGTPPACAGAYGMTAASGKGALDAPSAQCSCSCTGPTNQVCQMASTALYQDQQCGQISQSEGFPANFCTNFPMTKGEITPSFAPIGYCTAAPSMTVPPATWGHAYNACHYTAPTDAPGGCGGGNTCLAAPTAGYDAKPCIYEGGDVACPGAPYTVKTVMYASFSDSRDCTGCACATNSTGGSCSGTVTFYSGVQCSGMSQSEPTDGSCHQLPFPAVSGEASTFTLASGTCGSPTTAPVASGAASPTGPTTVCCQP